METVLGMVLWAVQLFAALIFGCGALIFGINQYKIFAKSRARQKYREAMEAMYARYQVVWDYADHAWLIYGCEVDFESNMNGVRAPFYGVLRTFFKAKLRTVDSFSRAKVHFYNYMIISAVAKEVAVVSEVARKSGHYLPKSVGSQMMQMWTQNHHLMMMARIALKKMGFDLATIDSYVADIPA